MRELLIVETRDAAEHCGPERLARLAAGLSRRGIRASILLAENGAFSAARSAGGDLEAAMMAGVAVMVDRFALDERAIRLDDLHEGVRATEIDVVLDRLAAGAAVIWR